MSVVIITSDDAINWTAKTEREMKINQIANICKTRKGESPFLREVGIADDFIDKPITLIKPALINEITAEINENVEGVGLQSIDIINGDISGNFIIKVVCDIE